VHQINRDQLRVLLDADAVTLVEALPEAHYDAEHLPGAVNLPGDLTTEVAARLVPDRGRTVVVYYSGPTCGRSKAAAAAFTRLGCTDVRVYAGGKADWAQVGLPLHGSRALPDAA
jgi:rhodanese-related sulfurtransferase